MPFFSSSRLAYHCGYKTTAMLCSSGAKDNWQCKLTAVIRRQGGSDSGRLRQRHAAAMVQASAMCHRAMPTVQSFAMVHSSAMCHRRIATVQAFAMVQASAMCHRGIATVQAFAMCYRAFPTVQAPAFCDCQKLSRAGVHTSGVRHASFLFSD